MAVMSVRVNVPDRSNGDRRAAWIDLPIPPWALALAFGGPGASMGSDDGLYVAGYSFEMEVPKRIASVLPKGEVTRDQMGDVNALAAIVESADDEWLAKVDSWLGDGTYEVSDPVAAASLLINEFGVHGRDCVWEMAFGHDPNGYAPLTAAAAVELADERRDPEDERVTSLYTLGDLRMALAIGREFRNCDVTLEERAPATWKLEDVVSRLERIVDKEACSEGANDAAFLVADDAVRRVDDPWEVLGIAARELGYPAPVTAAGRVEALSGRDGNPTLEETCRQVADKRDMDDDTGKEPGEHEI